ncbi:MAG: hydrogenase maturation nickel metallochaperone HypA [Lachnospiraceae bacterium]|jgi:hydrogenase nickel insertion protein HypA|nr:hydrogenase maturation nickel metallochaperone HypA [Lachnospiraceae bacterium]MDY6335380.1 hydrogenase maturation nickel metallochaperone HypA [Lachnospiraceae bacterium]
MHELAATESLLAAALRAAEGAGAGKVHRIVVSIGHYTGILPEYVEKYFPTASSGTAAEGAALEFHVLPVRVVCGSCGAESELSAEGAAAEDPEYECGVCGSREFRLLPSNWDIRVESIEVD